MAETIVAPTSKGADYGSGDKTAIAVAATDTFICTLTVPTGATRLFVQVKISHGSAVAFDKFTMFWRPTADASFDAFATAAGDYSTPLHPLLSVTGAPVTLSQNSISSIQVDVTGAQAITILASGNAAPTTADLHYLFA